MSSIDMQKDLEFIDRSLQSLVRAKIHSPSNEIPMYFDQIHLSPLKVSTQHRSLNSSLLLSDRFM